MKQQEKAPEIREAEAGPLSARERREIRARMRKFLACLQPIPARAIGNKDDAVTLDGWIEIRAVDIHGDPDLSGARDWFRAYAVEYITATGGSYWEPPDMDVVTYKVSKSTLEACRLALELHFATILDQVAQSIAEEAM